MKTIHVSGTRKSAIARVTLKDGKGDVRVNKKQLDFYEPEMSRMKIKEPLLLAGKTITNKLSINVNVSGGGYNGQAEAARLAIARALAQYDKNLENVLQKYDRHLLVADVRRKEQRKPNRHGKARAKRQKSYR